MANVFLVKHDTDDTHEKIVKIFETKQAAENHVDVLLKEEYQQYLNHYPTYEEFYSDFYYYYHVEEWEVSK